MNLEIISSEGIVFQGEVTKVTFPGELGSFTVLEDCRYRRRICRCK